MCPGQICFLTGKQLMAVCGFGDQALGVGGGRGGEGARSLALGAAQPQKKAVAHPARTFVLPHPSGGTVLATG